jgi:hypothetical protein
MRYYRDKGRNYEVMTFGGLQDVVKAAGIAWKCRGRSRHRIDRGDFVEGKTPVLGDRYFRDDWADVEKAIGTPWLHGLRVIQDMRKELAKLKLPQPLSVRRVPSFSSDRGDEIDYDRLRSGQDFWRTCSREDARGPKLVTVLTDVTTSAYVDSEEILWRGAAALAMTDVLERQGYRVELWGFHHVSDDGYTDGSGLFGAVKFKDAGKPLNVTALACGVSGWFYRSVFFQSYYLAKNTPTSGLGHVAHGLYPWQRDLITTEENPVVLMDVWSKESAVRQAADWIRAVCLGEEVPGLDRGIRREYRGGVRVKRASRYRRS